MPKLPFIVSIMLLTGPLVGLAPVFSQDTIYATDVAVLQQLAAERYAEGDLERAAELYLEIAQAEKLVDEKAKALFTASWLQHLAGRQLPAQDTLTRALRLEPDHPFDPSLYNREFELLYEQSRQVAIRERQRDANEKIRLAIAELEAGRTDQARHQLEMALELAPDNPTAVYNLASLDLAAGNPEVALPHFERTVSLTFHDTSTSMTELRAKALTSIGVIYHSRGRYDDAEQAFLEATRADPREASAWKNLGLTRIQKEDFENSVGPLERAHELAPDERETTLALARALRENDRGGQAVAMLEADLRQHPDAAELWILLGRIEYQQGDPAGSLSALERAIDADPENRQQIAADAAILMTSIHLEQENYASAVAAAHQAVELDAGQWQAWSTLGQAQLAEDDLQGAIVSLTRATELEPPSIEPLLDLGAAYANASQLQQAEATYLRALSREPGSLEASRRLEEVRQDLAAQRDIVAGKRKPVKPIPPKKIGLEFADLNYNGLQLRGALVKQVKKKGPAARSGLRKGDLILWVGDYEVLSDKDFFQYLKRNPPGELIEVEYLRDGRIYDTEIQLRRDS